MRSARPADKVNPSRSDPINKERPSVSIQTITPFLWFDRQAE
jgi:hypothetical protein